MLGMHLSLQVQTGAEPAAQAPSPRLELVGVVCFSRARLLPIPTTYPLPVPKRQKRPQLSAPASIGRPRY